MKAKELTQKDKNTILVINRFLNRIKNNPTQSVKSFKLENNDLDFHVFIFSRIRESGIVQNISNDRKNPYYVSDYDVLNIDDYFILVNKVKNRNKVFRSNRTSKLKEVQENNQVLKEAFSRMNNFFTSKEFTNECRQISNSDYFHKLVGKGEVVPSFLKDKTTKISKFTYEKKIKHLNNPKQSKKSDAKVVNKPIEEVKKARPQKSIVILWGLINIKF